MYLCFILRVLVEESLRSVFVRIVPGRCMPFSSSMCTAIEKRRQKAGSRTPAIADLRGWDVRY